MRLGGALLLAGLLSGGEEEKVHRRESPAAVGEGLAYLVSAQREDDAWGRATETRGNEIYSMVPGSHDAFRVATTALVVLALGELASTPAERAALARGLEHLATQGHAKRDTGDMIYNIWAHIYALQALSVELGREHPPALLARVRKMAEWHLDRLVRYETLTGGWNYYDFRAQTRRPSLEPTSFSTSAGLVALWHARQAGLQVPDGLVERALRRLEEMRLPGGAYLYGSDSKYWPRAAHNRVRGSLGRTQAGNCALWLWGSKKVGEKEAREGLDVFFKEHPFIDFGRKRIWPHEAWYATAPYYYYFGHYYAARLIEKLGEAGRRDYASKMHEAILPHQEPDGSWWDYPMWGYGKPYGTAYALLILKRCR
ncbi:MAG: hypothetical protein L0216_19470 [Planctomycetales bacterium]|nr:hypothetical protein [Planctomycetales bacterium]